MLFVDVEVRPSSIPGVGLGLFAAQTIARGEVVFRWTHGWDVQFTETEYNALSSRSQAFLQKYGWRVGTDWRASLDESRYTNHSRTWQNIRCSPLGEMVALRDIADGEELLEDYSEFDPDFAEYGHLMTEAGVAARGEG